MPLRPCLAFHMNFVCIMSDTVRRDYLGCYGAAQSRTPRVDQFAAESLVFDRAHCGSFPTLPCRADMFTGKFVWPYMQWSPLPKSEVSLAELLQDAGYHCAMVTDSLPLCRQRYDYMRGFHSRVRVRGQWYDNYQPKDTPFEWPCDQEKLGGRDRDRIQQYLRNVAGVTEEADYFAPRVASEAVHWLEQNHDGSPFFLYVDFYDPHEPWDPPERFLQQYAPDGCERIIHPIAGPADRYNERELQDIKALYSGELTLVDECIGSIFDSIDALGRRDDTVVIYMSDHGTFLGDRNRMGKMGGRGQGMVGWPTYWELSSIPFVWRVPGLDPGRLPAFAHPADIAPTLLSLAGVPVPERMKAADLSPVLRGERDSVRDMAISSWSKRDWSVHRPSVIRTDEWALVYWRVGVKPELYHLPTDPLEQTDVYADNQPVARELHRRYLRFLRGNGVTGKNYWSQTLMRTFGSSRLGQSVAVAEPGA